MKAVTTHKILKLSLVFAGVAVAGAIASVNGAEAQSGLLAPQAPVLTTPGLVGPTAPRPFGAIGTTPVKPTIQVSVASMVNDDAISTFDLSQRMLWMVITSREQPTAEDMPYIQSDALDALIDERLEVQELVRQAKTRKKPPGYFFASDDQVDGYLTRIANSNQLTLPQFMAMMKSRGLTEASIREQVRVQQSWLDFTRNYYGPRIIVGNDQLRQAVARITASADKPSYLTAQIFIDASRTGSMANAMASANQRRQQLEQGAAFDALARQFSSLPNAANGGDAGWLTAGQFPPEVEAVLPLMGLSTVQIVPTKEGVYLILLREKKVGAASTVLAMKQINVKLPADASSGAVQAAENRLNTVRGRLNGCANIDQQARSAGLAVDDLGESEPEQLLPAVRDAVQKLQPGQVAVPVRTAGGLHLIAVCGRRAVGADIPTAEDIGQQLASEQLSMLQRRQLRDLRSAAVITEPR